MSELPKQVRFKPVTIEFTFVDNNEPPSYRAQVALNRGLGDLMIVDAVAERGSVIEAGIRPATEIEEADNLAMDGWVAYALQKQPDKKQWESCWYFYLGEDEGWLRYELYSGWATDF